MSNRVTTRVARVVGGPLDGGKAFVNAECGGRPRRPNWPRVITLGYGATHEEPWPHQWLDYHRQPDGSYRYAAPAEEVA